MTTRWLAAAIALGLAAPATAQAPAAMPGMPAEAPCPATPPPLPPEYSGWATKPPLAAAADAAAARTPLAIGSAVTLRLLPTPALAYPVRPQHPGDATTHGGVVGFTVAVRGTYHVALGAGAWIDVVAGGKALVATAHGHGPACSGIRKLVDFALTPGRYLLEIAAADAPTLAVMVAPAR